MTAYKSLHPVSTAPPFARCRGIPIRGSPCRMNVSEKSRIPKSNTHTMRQKVPAEKEIPGARKRLEPRRGNHLSDTTCLTQVFLLLLLLLYLLPTTYYFNCGESCSKVWRSLTLETAHRTNEAVLDK